MDRYELEDTAGTGCWHAVMEFIKDPTGDWVKYEDAKALEDENKELKAQIENRNEIIELTNQDMINLNEELKNLKAVSKIIIDAGRKLLAEGE